MFVIETYSTDQKQWLKMPGDNNIWESREEAEKQINNLDPEYQYRVIDID